MAQFENIKDLDDFVENQIMPACTQFDSQINELETKIKNCVTIQDTGNYVQQYDFDQLKIEVEDISGLPWIEIDFPEDIVRATETVLPQLPI